MLLTVVSLFMTLSSSAKLDKLKRQNNQMREQLDKLKSEYESLIKRLKSVESDPTKKPTSAAKTATAAGGNGASTQSVAPAATKMSEQDQLELVKSNAYRLQAILEGYAMEQHGTYPGSLDSLDSYANQTFTNEVVTNPFLNKQAYITDGDMCLDITTVPADEGIPENAGKLLFQANTDDEGKVADYTIACFDGDGLLVRNNDGNIFTISRN